MKESDGQDGRGIKISGGIVLCNGRGVTREKSQFQTCVEKFIARTNAKTAVFETGGHLITGHGDAVSVAIKQFIENQDK